MDDPCKEISELVKAIASDPDVVEVIQVEGFPLACEVRVSEGDYKAVMERLQAINRLASSFAGLPEGKQITVHVIPV